MMKFVLQKMKVENPAQVKYTLLDKEHPLVMNDLIGKEITLSHTNNKYCSICGNNVKKFFGQGFCYPCFIKAPENSECIIRPELCRGHEGEGRDPDWEVQNHVQAHVVYLALTSAAKVGVTRKVSTVSRWIDQGAWKAVVLAEVPNRYLAGKLEVALKAHMSDKTNWRKMLKNEMNFSFDLAAFKNDILNLVPDDLKQYIVEGEEVLEINFPVKEYPLKVVSCNFDKTPEISGTLKGIRGQYLFFEEGKVLNVRKFSGYEVELSVSESQSEQMSLF
ncbi:MAG: hypothetical protein ACJAZ2_000478 [Glaciecola sp.]|jgi:hypothetical protein